MFRLTEEELKEINSGGKPVFKEGEEVTVTCLSTEERQDDKGKVYLIKMAIENTDNAGKQFTIWVKKYNRFSLPQLKNLLCTVVTEKDINNGIDLAMTLVGKRFSCVPSKGGNGYFNWYDWKHVSNTPDIGGGSTPDVNDIPF